MTKAEFDTLKIGDEIVLNGHCKRNAGVHCTVIDIDSFNRIVDIQTINNTPIYISCGKRTGIKTIWNSFSYQSVNLIQKGTK